jgi:multidrug efflux pump
MMCAKLLKRHDPKHQSRFYKSTENFYNRVIEFYGRTLKFVLQHQTTTLLVTAGTLVLTALSLRSRAQGLFPGAGYGRILGISEGPQNVSFPALAKSQQALAQVILKIATWRAFRPLSESTAPTLLPTAGVFRST